MLVKFLPTYTGGGLGSINYLLNERKAAGTARVIKGDENLTRAIIKGISFSQKTCFGVLSFEEKHDFLDEEQKLKIIKDFERALLGDYMLERVNVLWVEHSDKNGRLELNFLIPKIDMPTGKSFNPYLAKFDQHRIDLIKRMINDEYSLSSPDDPAREQTISASKKNIVHYQNLEELDKKLHELVREGYIKNRDHMIELLNQSGIEVTRSTKKSITVVLPNLKTKNRLKGGIYDANFTGAQGDLENSAKAQAEEFESSIIETHKQSAKEIGESLKNSLKSEIDSIGVNLESRLQEIISIQRKNKRWILALTATIALIIGIVSGYQIRSYAVELQIKKTRSDTIKELQAILNEQTKEMEAMRVWTIPQAWRHSETESDGRMQYYISVPRSKEIFEKNDKYYIPMRTE